MPKAIDITAERYGRLIAIEKDCDKSNKGRTFWICRCDCGTTKSIPLSSLRGGHSKSCGCLHKEQLAQNNTLLKTKHGMSNNRLYNIHRSMKKRCYLETNKDYVRYGGRGIKICDEWLNDRESFFDWALNNGYDDSLSLDRIDVNGDYEPSNCRWATAKEQSNNKRNNRILERNGESKTCSEWADELDLTPSAISKRLKYGWSSSKTLELPKQK